MNTRAQTKLRKELDDELVGNTEPVTSFDQVRHLPYLNACINEALRLHSTSSLGLPRLVPEGGLEVCGRWYPEGTVLSVPSYTIHRDAEVWGADFEEYRYGGSPVGLIQGLIHVNADRNAGWKDLKPLFKRHLMLSPMVLGVF